MFTVNGREVIFQVSFMLEHDGVATVDLPINPGVVAKFEILQLPTELQDFQSSDVRSDRSNWERVINTNANGNFMTFSMPYLREHVANVTPVFDFGETAGGMLSARIGRQQLAGAMLVHLEVYGRQITHTRI